MRLSAHQPAYLPWLGYFHKIATVDVFVFLDEVQFEKNSFTNRNRIKTPQGPLWLTVPVRSKGHLGGSLRDLGIDEGQPWRIKHLKSIEANYRKAPFFAQNFPKLERLLSGSDAGLTEMCWQQLRFWLDELGIGTRIVRQSALAPTGRKSDLVLGLCQQLGASHYLSGALGRDYLQVTDFAASGIEVEFQQFAHPHYPQAWGDFEPCLSVVDAWMHCGPDTGRQLGLAPMEPAHA